MPNILFASNNISHFPTAVSGNVVGAYDPERVPYTIATSNYELLNSPSFVPTTGTVTWFHFRTFFTNAQAPNNIGVFFKAMDATGKTIVELYRRSGSSIFADLVLHNGSTTLVGLSTLPLTNSKLNFIDVKLTVTNLQIACEYYVNGALSATAVFNTNPNNIGLPTRFSIGAGFVNALTGPNGTQHFSEIIVADDDTRNARLNLLRPNLAGAYEQWLGSIAVLADDDTTTGMTTIAAGQRQNVKLTAYTGAANVSNFVSITATTRGQNSPPRLRHSIRLSAVDYDGPVKEIPFTLAYQVTDNKINPATSLPWTAADIAAIETGFVSVA